MVFRLPGLYMNSRFSLFCLIWFRALAANRDVQRQRHE